MISDMADWDSRYREGQHAADEPHPLIVEFASKLDPGRALDIASGAGRHAVWLAERGWQVAAVDYSRAGMEILQQRAREKGVAIYAIVADLERGEFRIEPESYDLIVVCNYLQRDLFPSIRAGTRIGGVVIAAISMVDEDPDVRPMNPDYLLRAGELRSEFAGWKVIHDFEGKTSGNPWKRATAEIVARKPA
jgi:tellurite methyltransferase